MTRWPVVLPPLLVGLLIIGLWQGYVSLSGVPPYLLPGPVVVAGTLIADAPVLLPALAATLRTTLAALVLALSGGSLLAIAMSRARLLERALLPFAVVLQVTPVIAIAPLLMIYWGSDAAVLGAAFLVAFFPIFATLHAGLRAVDPAARDLFRQLGASRWQTLLGLELPAALPYAVAGLRIGGGLSLVAAVVAEFAAGSAGAEAGLAYRLLEAQYRLNTPRLFAALVLLALAGLAVHGATALVGRVALRRFRRGDISQSASRV